MDKVISATLKILGVLAGVLILYFIRDVIAYFLIAFILASALRPGVDYFERKKIPRILSSILMFLIFFGLIGVVIGFTLPMFVTEFQNFLNSAPQGLQSITNWLTRIEKTTGGLIMAEQIQNTLSNFFQGLSTSFTSTLTIVSKFFSGLVNVAFVVIITFYFMIEKEVPERLSSLFLSGNKKLENKVLKSWKKAEKLAGRWLQGFLILGTIVAVLVYISLTILGVKYALILALIAGLLEVIPLIGPLISGLIGVSFGIFQGGFTLGLWVAIVFLLVQQLENFIIVPLVMKNRVYLQPILVIIVLFIGSRIGGLLGAIISVPLIAIFLAIIKDHYPNYLPQRPKFLSRFSG
jgi:predicted PurR-regulated permease PerM